MTKEQKTIKLLIELDEDYYHKIMTIKPVHYTARVYISIQNGTPLNECKAEDCISREQALKNIVAWSDEEIIRNLPSVTPKSEKPSGKWITNAPQYDMLNPQYICSECGNAHTRITPYCEMCSAKMEEK